VPFPFFSSYRQSHRLSALPPLAGKTACHRRGAGGRPARPLETEGWWQDAAQTESLRRPLLRLCATYLTSTTGPKSFADPVARFHLSNGARLERVNWLGNAAPRGIQESYGIMVNYLYDPKTIEANHEAFAQDGTVVRSPDVDALLAAAAPSVRIAASRD
jgi:malonyl-CoA decarboxylase